MLPQPTLRVKGGVGPGWADGIYFLSPPEENQGANAKGTIQPKNESRQPRKKDGAPPPALADTPVSTFPWGTEDRPGAAHLEQSVQSLTA